MIKYSFILLALGLVPGIAQYSNATSEQPRAVEETLTQSGNISDAKLPQGVALENFPGDNTESDTQSDEVKFFGDYVIESGDINRSKVRIVGGDLTVYGQIDGEFTIIGGDIYIKSGAIVNGRIIAIGGTVHQESGAQVRGRIIETNISKGLSFKETTSESNGVEGESDFMLKERSWYSRSSWIHPKTFWFIYNRNEGLLITPFNYRWDRRSLSNLRLNLSAGWRFSQNTYTGRITGEVYLLNRHFILFGSGFKESRTDDFYRLPELENSLAGILGRQDFYDRWDESGFEVGVGFDLNWIRIRATYVSASQDSIPVDQNLWTVFNDNRALRDNLPVIPGDVESARISFAFKPRHFNPYKSGIAVYVTAEQILETQMYDHFQRLLGMGIIGLEITPGVIIRSRLLAGTATGTLPEFRYFGVGGLGSIAAYPYKKKWNGDPWHGDRFVQLNTEIIFTPDFVDDDWTLILFTDSGDAWMATEYDITSIDDIINNGKSSVGIGLASSDHDDIDWRINFAKPLDGTEYWESTLRINFNF